MTKQQLETDFTRRGIDFSSPGFFDHPRFVEAERKDPEFLEKYADYVHLRQYSESYCAHARGVIRRAADHLHRELKADGRKGACIDASMVLSGILTREGIWNCMMMGGATVAFQSGSGLEPRYMQPLMGKSNSAKTGHAWVYAPPFRVVDVTIDLQPYTSGESRFITGPILDEAPVDASYTIEDLAEEEIRTWFRGHFGRHMTLDDANRQVPGIRARIAKFGCFTSSLPKAKVTYVACAASAPDAPLEEMRNLILKGKLPHVLYNDFKQGATP
jgi:hypothetical protein